VAAARKFWRCQFGYFGVKWFYRPVQWLGVTQMKKRRLLMFLVFALIVGATVAIFVARSSRHQTLNGYIEELRARGEKMTFEELIASLSPHTNDSLAVLTNVVLQLGALPGDATNIDIMHYVGPGRAQVAWNLSEPTWAVSAVCGSRVTWTDVGDRVARMAAQLAELRKAMQNPAPNAGYRTNCFESPTPFLPVRSAAYWLASEALRNLHQGRRSEALGSVQAIAGLADLHREEYVLVSQMLRAVIGDFGLRLTWESLQTNEWSDEQMLALQKSWEGFNFLEAAERGMEGERCMGRASVEKLSEKDPSFKERLSTSYYGTNFLDGDLLFQLRHFQDYVEQLRALRANRAWTDVSVSLDKLNARIDGMAKSPERFHYLLSSIAVPNYKPAVLKCVQTEILRRLTITAIALDRYKHKHGQYPPSLEGLVPEFLTAVPRDCMDGQPLRYQFKGTGQFILYSVGEDGQDNGGDASLAKSGGQPGLWEGRDVVWPLPDY